MDQVITKNPLQGLLESRKTSRQMGIWSCCSANEFVVRATMRRARASGTVALIEATANQVNQDGGYTGMTPARFHAFVERIAAEEGMPPERVFCGGDHLGPLTWQHLPEAQAMERARILVESYVLAGFTKIHLDTSMRVADDDMSVRLSDETIARRGAELCAASEQAFRSYQASHPGAVPPIYIIGSEVPIPGGAQENEDSVTVTSPDDCRATLEAFRSAFLKRGLDEAWERVVGLVVQPGVEFADESVVTYDRAAARELTDCLKSWPNMVFEGHSTDYQPRECLREMVEDGIAILKVGPALTYALREGLFALESIEQELSLDDGSGGLRETLDAAMLADDRYWARYYRGTPQQQRFSRAFSFSDRARYYLPAEAVTDAVGKLLGNLGNVTIPLALLSQYLPMQYRRVRDGLLENHPEDLLLDHIGDCIDDYLYASIREEGD